MFSSLARTSVARQAVRSFAVDAAHKPPIEIYGMAARYANATFTAASKKGQLDRVEADLVALAQAAKESPAFAQFLVTPLIGRNAKIAQVTEMLKPKTCETTLNLMTTLAGNARLVDLNTIVDIFVRMMAAKRGQVDAIITSAEALTKTQAEAISKAMKAQVGASKTINLKMKVDPSIMGGLQVQIGDQFMDLSVASKIDAISRTPV
jgi:F-type H+-transporting ATPase subunit O